MIQPAVQCPRRLGPVALGVLLALAGAVVTANEPPAESAAAVLYQDIDIDQLVATARPEKAGTSVFFRPSPVRFGGRIKQEPRERKVEYLYTALSFFPLDPEPKVSHRMFVETTGGHILPVYVEDSQVQGLRQLGEGTAVILTGWHVYNYSKGPAILIIGHKRAALPMNEP